MNRPMSEEREKLEPCPKLREAIENGHLRCSVSVGVGSPVATIDTEDLWRLVHAAERYASTSSAERGMREALEWQPITTAPQGEDVLIAVFRDDFEDPINQNSILIDGEDKGLYWSDWHGMPEPTHWMRYSRPGAAPATPVITQAELVELLALMDVADGALDKDTYDQSLHDEFDAPDDADYSVCAGTVRKCSAVFAAIEKMRNRMVKP